MDSGLAGKVVLVTGGAGGIGIDLVKSFSAEGAKVAIHFNSSVDSAKELQNSIKGTPTCLVQGNLAKEDDVESVFNKTEKALGPVEIYVGNAGIWISQFTPIHQMSLEQWNKTLTTNLTSQFLCLRRFFLGIEKNKIESPSAVLIGSTAGVFGEAGHSDYAASKAAATAGLLPTLKNELARLAPLGRINAICPSWILTPMVEDFAKDTKAITRVLQTVALRKVGRPSDVASMAVFLASNKLAGHISGQSIIVSGGMEGRVLYDPSEIDPSRA
jgi:3-oxoacyl-[acyl-carrier protein] reductase